MLYIFKSQDSADLVMLEPNGRRVLEIIGKDTGPKGVIVPGQMAAAIAALESAVAAESRAPAEAGDSAPPKGGDTVSLRQRSLPFIDMLKRCQAQGKDIVWGV